MSGSVTGGRQAPSCIGARSATPREDGAVDVHLSVDPRLATVDRFVEAVERDVASFAALARPELASVTAVERGPGADGETLTVTAVHPAGESLAEILWRLAGAGTPPPTAAALYVIRELLDIVCDIHAHRAGAFHGALSLDAIVITEDQRVVVRDGVFGAALATTNLAPGTWWTQFGLAVPPTQGIPAFSQLTDQVQVGVVALSLLLGHAPAPDEYPSGVAALLASARERAIGGEIQPLGGTVRSWLARTLLISHEGPFRSIEVARDAFDEILDGESGYVAFPIGLEAMAVTDAGPTGEVAPAVRRDDVHGAPPSTPTAHTAYDPFTPVQAAHAQSDGTARPSFDPFTGKVLVLEPAPLVERATALSPASELGSDPDSRPCPAATDVSPGLVAVAGSTAVSLDPAEDTELSPSADRVDEDRAGSIEPRLALVSGPDDTPSDGAERREVAPATIPALAVVPDTAGGDLGAGTADGGLDVHDSAGPEVFHPFDVGQSSVSDTIDEALLPGNGEDVTLADDVDPGEQFDLSFEPTPGDDVLSSVDAIGLVEAHPVEVVQAETLVAAARASDPEANAAGAIVPTVDASAVTAPVVSADAVSPVAAESFVVAVQADAPEAGVPAVPVAADAPAEQVDSLDVADEAVVESHAATVEAPPLYSSASLDEAPRPVVPVVPIEAEPPARLYASVTPSQAEAAAPPRPLWEQAPDPAGDAPRPAAMLAPEVVADPIGSLSDAPRRRADDEFADRQRPNAGVADVAFPPSARDKQSDLLRAETSEVSRPDPWQRGFGEGDQPFLGATVPAPAAAPPKVDPPRDDRARGDERGITPPSRDRDPQADTTFDLPPVPFQDLPVEASPHLPEALHQRPSWRSKPPLVAAAVAVGLGAVAALGYFALVGRHADGRDPGQLRLESKPVGAIVRIDGVEQGMTPLSLKLAPGTYAIQFEREGEVRDITTEVLPNTDTPQMVTLYPAGPPGVVEVTTLPMGANIILNGEPRGTTPLRIERLAPGEYTLVAENTAQRVQRQVEVLPEQVTVIEVPLSGLVDFQSPIPLTVSDGQRQLGQVRNGVIAVAAGKRRLRLSNAELGYNEDKEVTVAPGEQVRVAVTPPNGVLNLSADIESEILIDGRPAGTTPLSNYSVALGLHEVTFRHARWGEQIYTVLVGLDKPNRLQVTMQGKTQRAAVARQQGNRPTLYRR